MNTPIRDFKRIFVHPESKDSILAERILSRLPNVPVEIWKEPKEIYKEIQQTSLDPYNEAKQCLVLMPFKGTFVKKCPGSNTKGAVCCNYFILNFMSQCPYDCAYCFLQDYLTNPLLTIYTNVDAMMDELGQHLSGRQDKLRVGTGELADSLATDHLTDFSLEICKLMDQFPSANLELKTKSTTIENLLKRPGKKNITISWSLNPPKVQQNYEKLTAKIEDRIQAAKVVLDHGYSIAFHFDPLIDQPIEEYEKCFKLIQNTVGAQALKWISLGSLRMTEGLKEVMNDRFPDNQLTNAEFLKSSDGKYRYAKPIRVEIFKSIYKLIAESGLNESPIYLCMESRDAWDKAMGGTPRKHPLFGA